MLRSYAAPLAIALWVSTALAAFVRAQDTTAKAAPVQSAQLLPSTAISNDSLKTMLTELGYTPKPLSKGFQITIKKNNWTFNIQAVLSDNQEKLGMNTIAGDVKEPMDVPAASWLALLETNPDIDPTTFYFDKQQKRLCLHRAMDNRGITAAIMSKELEAFCFDVVATRNLWRFTR